MSYTHAIETVLLAAANDRVFHDELKRDRLAAVDARGVSLTEAERNIIASLDDATLDQMILEIRNRPPAPMPMPEPRLVAPGGVRPDMFEPQPIPDNIGPAQGIRPDRPGPVKGIRPGRVLLAAAATTAIAGGGYYAAKALTASEDSAPADAGSESDSDSDTDSDTDTEPDR